MSAGIALQCTDRLIIHSCCRREQCCKQHHLYTFEQQWQQQYQHQWQETFKRTEEEKGEKYWGSLPVQGWIHLDPGKLL
jgi:hypothetical protein